jgi:hypothetical protein
MASDKALYTVALAVLALGLGNSLANNQPQWLRSLTNRSLAVAQEASGRAEGYLGMAQVILGSGQSGFGRTQAMIGRMQAELGSLQAQMGRRQAEVTRVEGEQARMIAMQTVSHMKVTCPRITMKLSRPLLVDASDEQ